MSLTLELSDDQLRNLEAVCANRWPAVRRILGICVEQPAADPVPEPDPIPVDRAGRDMFTEDGEPIPVEERTHEDG